MKPPRRFRVSFVLEPGGQFPVKLMLPHQLPAPTAEWLEEMVTGPGSLWTMRECKVEEEHAGSEGETR